MPYVLSGIIHSELPGLWGEGAPYTHSSIYEISNPAHPPVNYSAHTLKPHSIPHIDAPRHVMPDGATVEEFFSGDKLRSFYGPVVVLKLSGSRWEAVSGMQGTKVWRVTRQEIEQGLERLGVKGIPEKLLITAEDTPLNEQGLHDPNYVLVLAQETARWLVSSSGFNAYGTSWKSSDFEPGSRERPVHKILLAQALLFECLKLDHVPEGRYFFSGFPLTLAGASESPLTAVLYTKDELKALA